MVVGRVGGGCLRCWLLLAAGGWVGFVLPPLLRRRALLGGGVVRVVVGVEVGSAFGWVVRSPSGTVGPLALRLRLAWQSQARLRVVRLRRSVCLGWLTLPRAQVALDSSQSRFFVVCKSGENPCGVWVSGWPRVLAVLVAVMESIRVAGRAIVEGGSREWSRVSVEVTGWRSGGRETAPAGGVAGAVGGVGRLPIRRLSRRGSRR